MAADKDFDGKVDAGEFDHLIQLANEFPKKFGKTWFVGDKNFDTTKLFKEIDENNDGSISFNEWLLFCMKIYKSHLPELPKVPVEMSRDEYLKFSADVKEKKPEAAKAAYFHLLSIYQSADLDRDGKVSKEEFNNMLDSTLKVTKNLGINLSTHFQESNEKVFEEIDENKDGSISFDEWLGFALTKIVGGCSC